MLVPGEAVIKYGDNKWEMVSHGSFVRCAVSGKEIHVNDLCYWSVDLQEPYAGPPEVMKRLGLSFPTCINARLTSLHGVPR